MIRHSTAAISPITVPTSPNSLSRAATAQDRQHSSAAMTLGVSGQGSYRRPQIVRCRAGDAADGAERRACVAG